MRSGKGTHAKSAAVTVGLLNFWSFLVFDDSAQDEIEPVHPTAYGPNGVFVDEIVIGDRHVLSVLFDILELAQELSLRFGDPFEPLLARQQIKGLNFRSKRVFRKEMRGTDVPDPFPKRLRALPGDLKLFCSALVCQHLAWTKKPCLVQPAKKRVDLALTGIEVRDWRLLVNLAYLVSRDWLCTGDKCEQRSLIVREI